MADDPIAGKLWNAHGCRSFEALFAEQFPAVKYFFIRQGCTEEDSRDLTQEVFIAAFRGLKDFRGEADPKTWLLRIARNRMLNFLRGRRAAKRFEPQPATGSDEIGELPDLESRNPEQDALAGEQLGQIHSAIGELPKRMRQVLELRIQGLEYHEIAGLMNLSIETIKSHLHQARARLRPKPGVGPSGGAT